MPFNITLRPELPEDAEFLYALFASTRADEMSLTGWGAEEVEAFLRNQFALQTRHYRTYFAQTTFDVVMLGDKRVGRLYVERMPGSIVIHDIALIEEDRRKGIGSYLLTSVITEADGKKLPIQIFVEQQNPAMALYLRLGFQPVKLEGIYYLMERLPQGACDKSG